jgi:lipoate-protein ligase A
VTNEDTLRLIIDPPLPGVVNMACDEAILQAVNQSITPATLRFYQWIEPTISLGYFQEFDEIQSQHQQIKQMPVVRRQTGGGAILHDQELTYSLILPLDTNNSCFTDIQLMYRLVHDAYIEAMAGIGLKAQYRGGDDRGNSQRGPFFCFARKHCLDLVLGSDKILGSAQRRVKNAVLQHGSLILNRRFEQQPSAWLGVSDSGKFDLREFIGQVARLIAEKLKLKLSSGQLGDYEKQSSIEFQDKYQSDSWTQQRGKNR